MYNGLNDVVRCCNLRQGFSSALDSLSFHSKENKKARIMHKQKASEFQM